MRKRSQAEPLDGTAASVGAPPPDLPTPLLGGLTPAQFMRRYWQKKPLLIRQAIPGVTPPSRATRCSSWRATTTPNRA